ncbi:MAG TPA: glycosyltransferase family 4 protein, partial [Verrucomicrobiae bacterium]|nr:glycosyltransferase family 4 protein [Verrucomicrobiae bacterium]
ERPNHFGIQCYHVNARFSNSLEDIGELRFPKILRLILYCIEAIWCRFRYGVENFYYVPAPGKPVALYRDWLVMLLCRPFFKKIILHWHGGGMAKWLETVGSMRTRSFTYRLMKNADLSIVLTEFGRRDAEKLTAKRITIVSSGVPDPCPQFNENILPRRRARAAALKNFLSGQSVPASETDAVIRVLFVATCSREKGLFDAIEGVALANEKLAARKLPLRFHLALIGAFASAAEENEMHELIQRRGLQNTVEHLGFVSEERKEQALRDADVFCFPTYYNAENLPNSLMEAMGFGLPVVTTRWRAVAGMFPPGYPGLVEIKSPQQIADTLPLLAASEVAEALRENFLRRFTLERHLANIAAAIRSVE